MTAPCLFLFLSHAGVDAAEARALKARLLAAPDAQAVGLSVWLDLDDLVLGRPWQPQLDDAIAGASAFAVLFGANCARNWVRAEVDLAMSRAVKEDGFPFIPILLGAERRAAITPFARRYQAVRDPLADEDALAALLRAALGGGGVGRPKLTDDPFPGPRSMDEIWADRFFGRIQETDEVLDALRRIPLLAIVADSGAGKSSLAMAGVAAAWRGESRDGERPASDAPDIQHVVVMRPVADPIEGLLAGVSKAAEALGQGDDVRAALRNRIRGGDASEALYALECGLPVGTVRTLLIIDQAEELVTQTADPKKRAAFGRLIDAMLEIGGQSGRLRVLMTVRADYANVVAEVPGLGPRMAEESARYRLKAPAAAQIAQMIRRPLRLAGFDDRAQEDMLVDRIAADLSTRPGDLALAQMALHLVWRDRDQHGSMLSAYAAMGGVLGALGAEAERVSTKMLDPAERALLLPIFIRLVRLGETVGATRRTASLEEFDAPRRALIDRLASDECGRLLQVSQTSVEIAHEALITQWPKLQNQINDEASLVRALGDLTARTAQWSDGGERRRLLASDAEMERTVPVVAAHPDWLAATEARYAQRSASALRLAKWAVRGAAAAIMGLAVVALVFFQFAATARQDASDALTTAKEAEQSALIALALSRTETAPQDALKLILAAWPREGDAVPKASDAAFRAVGAAFQQPQLMASLEGHEGSVTSAAFSADGRFIVTASDDNTARVWDAADGAELRRLEGHEKLVRSAAFSADGRFIVTASEDHTARVWDAADGAELRRLGADGGGVNSAAFLTDGRFIVAASRDRTARVWDVASGEEIQRLEGNEGSVNRPVFSADGRFIVTGSDDGTARVWDAIQLPGNILQMACWALPMVKGARDLDISGLAEEIGLTDLPPLTPCEDYDPPMPPPLGAAPQ